jgi:uncharacterized protein YacL
MLNIGIVCSYLSLITCHKTMKQLTASLDEQESKDYKKIKKQRFMSYFIGLIIGLLLAVFYYKMYSYQPLFLRINCAILIFLIVPILVYSLIPRSYFLENVQDDSVKMEWFRVYNCMRYHFTLYFVLGFVISGILLHCFFNRVNYESYQ